MKRWEYRNIHLLLAPVYLRMCFWCLRHRLKPFDILKADYALDHGGATFASKFDIQQVFPRDTFPPTLRVRRDALREDNAAALIEFGERHGFGFIVKPDVGRIGFGVAQLHDAAEIRRFLDGMQTDYLAQKFIEGPLEFGVFYVRTRGVADVFAINSKEFPSVTGDGRRDVRALIERHERLRDFAGMFNTKPFAYVPADGERVSLSNVGSHTLGCVFRDVTHLKTPALIAAIDAAVGVPGFNYGRLDVRTQSVDDFKAGRFTIIEVNGVESLATNAFDPAFSYRDGLRWFTAQFRLLVEIAAEHRDAPMERLPFREIVRRVARAERQISKTGSLMHFSPVHQAPPRSDPLPAASQRKPRRS